jgi:hypothetical protein
VIYVSYIFKPSNKLTDRVARAVQALYEYDEELDISQFYEYAVEKALRDCESDPGNFAYQWKAHAGMKTP